MISNRFFTGFRRSLAALASGGVVFIQPNKINVPALVNYLNEVDIDHLSGVVIHAEKILGFAVSSDLLCPNLKSFIVSGSTISSRLADAIRNHITEKIFIGYGTNEIGEVAILAPNLMANRTNHSVGYLLDGINAKLHQRDGMTELWLNDKYGSQFYGDQNHQKTWFAPNDLATINKDGELSILGRTTTQSFLKVLPLRLLNLKITSEISATSKMLRLLGTSTSELGTSSHISGGRDISAFKICSDFSRETLRKKNIEYGWAKAFLVRQWEDPKRILKNIIAGMRRKDWTVSNFERVDLAGINKNDLGVEGEK